MCELTHEHVCIHIHISLHIRTYTRAHTHVQMYVFIYTFTYTYTHTCIRQMWRMWRIRISARATRTHPPCHAIAAKNIYSYMYISYTNINTYTKTYVQIHIHVTGTYTHTHTCTHVCARYGTFVSVRVQRGHMMHEVWPATAATNTHANTHMTGTAHLYQCACSAGTWSSTCYCGAPLCPATTRPRWHTRHGASLSPYLHENCRTGVNGMICNTMRRCS